MYSIIQLKLSYYHNPYKRNVKAELNAVQKSIASKQQRCSLQCLNRRLLHRALRASRRGNIRVRRRAGSLLLGPLHRLHPLLLSELGVLMRQHVSAASSYVVLLHNVLVRLTGHSVRAQLPALRHNARVARLPRPQTLLSIIQRLPRGLSVSVRWALLAGHDGRVVEQVNQLAGLSREQNLLLGALDDGRGVDVVGFFELLAGDVGELGFGDEGLGFGADELLLECDEFGGFGFFVFELLDLVLNLWVVLSVCVVSVA